MHSFKLFGGQLLMKPIGQGRMLSSLPTAINMKMTPDIGGIKRRYWVIALQRGEDQRSELHQLAATEKTDGAYLRPSTLSDLLQARAQHPQAQLIAGATDAGLWITQGLRRIPLPVA